MIITIHKDEAWIDQLKYATGMLEEGEKIMVIDTEIQSYTTDGVNWKDLEENHL